MRRVDTLTADFVDTMPDVLEDGVIYVSERYRVALHNCCCGCGEEVSTPLGPTEYSLWVEAGGVTVAPSIGNHDFACGSHYLIEGGRVVWAGAMSRAAIEAGRARDRALKRPRKTSRLRAFGSWIVRMVARLFR